MKLAPIALCALLALVLTASAPGQQRAARRGTAHPKALLPAQRDALLGIQHAEARHLIDHSAAAADRAIVNRAARLVRHLPSSRAVVVGASLAQAARLAHRLTAPRALIVFGQLSVTSSHLAHQNPPAQGTDVADADGVVYRYFSGGGYEFHPLGNFAALNLDVTLKQPDDARRLANALLDRGVQLSHGAMGWEYCFDYGGGRAPWLSGMAQAAAAQAFSGTADLVGGDTHRWKAAARAAYRAIPGRLAMRLPQGPWVRLYGFNSDVILNAQLQTALSIGLYADSTGDRGAASYAAQLRRAAASLLPRFDTGYWTYYQLPRTLSPLDYQQYVVQLLRRLGRFDPRFAAAAVRVGAYDTQPPAFKLADPALGHVRFWLSKPAGVTVRSSAGATQNFQLNGGWYDVGWKLPSRPGAFPVQIIARDWAGNRAAVDALPIVRVGSSGAPASRAPAALAAGPPAFAAGAFIDDPAQAKLARARGLSAVRVSVVPGDPDASAALKTIRAPGRILVELVADPLPADDGGRSDLAAYAASLVQQVPGIKDVLLGPPPTVTTAPDYMQALAVLRASLPSVQVGGELDGAAKPAATLTALGRAYADEGLPSTVMSELAFRPAPKSTTTAWTLADYPKLVAALGTAFARTAQPGATLPILADGVAANQAIASLQTASCLPTVTGLLLARLVDGSLPGEQTGIYRADLTAKSNAVEIGKAAVRAVRGVLQICPGLGVPATPSTLVFPDQLTHGTRPAVKLGCVRDCLYLVTLEHAGDGRPVLAARGELRGGAAVKTITLPAAAYPAGSYRLVVRLVTATNPGKVRLLASPVLSG